jgi:hypothetical protein
MRSSVRVRVQGDITSKGSKDQGVMTDHPRGLSTSRNVNIYDDLIVTLHLFIMEVVSTVMNFLTSSHITNDNTKPLKIMTKCSESSQKTGPCSS